jgi:transposase
MSHFIFGQSRHQANLPEVLDDFIAKENPVRVIDVFVNELDMARLSFKRTSPKNTGRPGYDPATMLKLYIYGYLNRIQSSRRLERETQRNIELMWLLERLTPDFKTIADFRKDNGKGIKNCCRTFVELCRKLNMFEDAVIAIDGSKFKAVNSKKNNYTPAKLKSHIERVEKNIQVYLNQLNNADYDDSLGAEMTLLEKIAAVKLRLAELKSLKKKLNAPQINKYRP